MINFLSSWVKNLSLSLIIVSILEMLLPNNKSKKYVKMIMGLYVLFSIISPFIEKSDLINLNQINLDTYAETISTTTEVDQTSMDKRLDEIYVEELEKDIIQKLKDLEYEIEECRVKAHISQENSGIEKITIKVKEKIVSDNNARNENTLESKLVEEVQKIKKVEIQISDNNSDNNFDNNLDTNTENVSEGKTNITKTDIKIIKDFLINEYGVNEKCLKIS